VSDATHLVIAGGGTGGHLFPGIAVAEALLQEAPDARVLFVGTERGIEARAVPKAGFDVEFIDIGGLKRVGVKRMLKTFVDLPRSVFASRAILKRFGATAVLGVGGYASGPVVTAARTMGVPTAICEQNSVPGLTNKLLSKVVRRVYASFEASRGYFSPSKFSLVGNPVRSAFLAAAAGDAPEVAADRVFIFGGSQGARPINQAAPEAIAALRERGVDVQVVHQAGKHDTGDVRAAYAAVGVDDADVREFIDDMVTEYRRAAVVLCRAGATSCAELTVLGAPAVLVPFPQAADDHQTLNARDLVDQDAAVMLPQSEMTADRLANELDAMLTNRARRDAVAAAAKAMGRPDAAAVVARAAMGGFTEEVSS
jgi:UDP-N-acetylglucosamine--N-acetylmuramyl-(pentapeptide) pyrophosphoryl-undecaprenol N-acetylglucosamine transferase